MAGIDFDSIKTDILRLGPRNLIGLDIGLSAIKVAEVLEVKKGQYKLNRFSAIPLQDGCLIEDEIQKHDEIVDSINEAIRTAGIKNKNICLGLFGSNTIAKRLQLATGSSEDIEDQVMWESEQYIPFGVDDSTVAYHVIGENLGGGTDVIIAAARNDIVETFGLLVEDANLKMKVADLQFFALTNLFEATLGDQLKGSEDVYVLIDFGAAKTNLVVYKDESIIFTKEINIGGIMITEEIQRQMGASYIEAENLKINGGANGNSPQEIVDIFSTLLDSYYSELKKALNFFMNASSIESIEHCYITGGSSLIPGLAEGLENLIGTKVQFLNPFEKMAVNSKLIPEEQLTLIATSGSVALGLGMRRLD